MEMTEFIGRVEEREALADEGDALFGGAAFGGAGDVEGADGDAGLGAGAELGEGAEGGGVGGAPAEDAAVGGGGGGARARRFGLGLPQARDLEGALDAGGGIDG